jgi:hypothetical protein
MIRIVLQEPTSEGWAEWRDKCRKETKLLSDSIAGPERREVNEALYKKQKEVIAALYGRKCGYCETRILRQSCDLDHFRPKGRVMDKNRKPVEIVAAAGTRAAHPGYYWLTYDWRNLVPTCSFCNRPNSAYEGASRIKFGKWDYFPLEDEFRATQPGEEEKEKPLLLHPLVDEPAEHLEFDENGIVGGKTSRGRTTVEMLGLNEDDLVDARRDAFENAYRTAFAYLLAKLHGAAAVKERKAYEKYRKGTAPYMAMAKIAIRVAKQAVQTATQEVFDE